jgi:hypothetical protein
MKPKRCYVRRSRNASDKGDALPMTFEELLRHGGPDGMIERAERQAGDAEARFWLGVLEKLIQEDVDDIMLSAIVHGWIMSLRKRLGIRPSPDAIRAQTRERVRRYRARLKAC